MATECMFGMILENVQRHSKFQDSSSQIVDSTLILYKKNLVRLSKTISNNNVIFTIIFIFHIYSAF